VGHYPLRRLSADWWMLTTANAAGINGLMCLLKHGGVQDSKFLVPNLIGWPTLLNFRNCTPSVLTAGSSNLSGPSSQQTYRSRFIPEGIVEASQIFLQDAQDLLKWLSYEEDCIDVTDGKPIAAWLLRSSGVGAVNPLVAFCDIHGSKGDMIFFCSVPDTTRDFFLYFLS
jgi:hypothetical protein